MTYTTKRDWKYFNLHDIETPEQADEIMFELDEVKADIEAQIAHYDIDAKSGATEQDEHWRINALRALAGYKALRHRCTARRGELSMQRKNGVQSSIERMFVDSAVQLLSKEQIVAIWDEVHKHQAR